MSFLGNLFAKSNGPIAAKEVCAYVQTDRFGKMDVACAFFAVDEPFCTDERWLLQVANSVGDLHERMEQASGKVLADPEWKALFRTWSKGIQHGRRCIRLPDGVCCGHPCYALMLFTEKTLGGKLPEMDLQTRKIPANHLMRAQLVPDKDISKMMLTF